MQQKQILIAEIQKEFNELIEEEKKWKRKQEKIQTLSINPEAIQKSRKNSNMNDLFLLEEFIREILIEELSAKTKATLKKKAEERGFTPGSVEAEYKKGLAAWASSGSRKGMTQHQWAMARVNSASPSKSWACVKKSKAKKKK